MLDTESVVRPLRDKDPGAYRLITVRTEEARLWMIPSEHMNAIIGGALARYQEACGILIFAYTFLSNHYHLVIQAPQANADEFEENVNREIARRVNKLHKRKGKFWARRYDDQKILREEDLLEAFVYVTTNGVRHGMVEDPADWPGLNSYEHALSEEHREFTFFRSSVRNPAERETRHTLTLSPLPQFAHLAPAERRVELLRLLKARADGIVDSRYETGQGFLGRRQIISQTPGTIPINVSTRPRPPCYTKDSGLRREFQLERRSRRESYTVASRRYRLGESEIAFPLYSYKPPLHRLPRSAPFVPLPRDFYSAAT